MQGIQVNKPNESTSRAELNLMNSNEPSKDIQAMVNLTFTNENVVLIFCMCSLRYVAVKYYRNVATVEV